MQIDFPPTTKTLLGKRTLRDVINRYTDEFMPEKRGAASIAKSLHDIGLSCPFLGDPLERLTVEIISEWLAQRLSGIAASHATYELNLVTALLEVARAELGWIKNNPALSIARPPIPANDRSAPVPRRVSDVEIQTMCEAMGYEDGSMAASGSQYTAVAFILSVETGMRKNEALALRWSDVFLDEGYISIMGSEIEEIRKIPLSKKATALFSQLFRFEDDERCIPVAHHFASKTWTMAKKRAMQRLPSLEDLKFTDSRYEATARMAKNFSLLSLSKILDHANLPTLVPYYLEPEV
ncbi:tyrosine-type recombinase/integrase [Paraburkholderia sp. LEh10]|uniref:tyrosine-type recombinase/integrase n=1 Tax=Paraburkholderia sp. LEh10 TaxID=2821353 RepID=UPI001AE62C08|nr:tyrosine-type recombinase/integrase [Paraburkholderia sp. LEh10]MBP0589266.1 tyrosine-type recombinase/integrase [Paraburkholderia sp. LEh10]